MMLLFCWNLGLHDLYLTSQWATSTESCWVAGAYLKADVNTGSTLMDGSSETRVYTEALAGRILLWFRVMRSVQHQDCIRCLF